MAALLFELSDCQHGINFPFCTYNCGAVLKTTRVLLVQNMSKQGLWVNRASCIKLVLPTHVHVWADRRALQGLMPEGFGRGNVIMLMGLAMSCLMLIPPQTVSSGKNQRASGSDGRREFLSKSSPWLTSPSPGPWPKTSEVPQSCGWLLAKRYVSLISPASPEEPPERGRMEDQSSGLPPN